MENNIQTERQKQQAYWKLFAYNQLSSLTQLINHHQQPSAYTQTDYDWRDWYFSDRIHINGQQCLLTFIERAKLYYKPIKTFDRVSLYESQMFQLQIKKHDFWNRMRKLKPKSKQNYQTRKIVREKLMQVRYPMYFGTILFTTIFNHFTGIRKLNFFNQGAVYGLFLLIVECTIRFKKSSQIFYSIPKLPSPEYEEERKRIVNECLIFDGTIINYSKLPPTALMFSDNLERQTERDKMENLIEAIGYKIIKMDE